MARKTVFAVGERWFYTNNASPVPFEFVIVGSGSTKDRKRCRLEVIKHPEKCDGKFPCLGERCFHNHQGDYTRKHLRRVAKHILPPTVYEEPSGAFGDSLEEEWARDFYELEQAMEAELEQSETEE
jgi:hypothetical protein